MLYPLVHWLPLAVFLLGFVYDGSVVHADADFESVRVSLKEDRSGKAGDPIEKYFRQSCALWLCVYVFELTQTIR